MRILIIKPSSFGDIVMTLPALALLRRAHPEAELGWFVNAEFAGLLDGHPMLARLHVWDRGRRGSITGFVRGAVSLRRVLREVRAAGYDVAYDFQGLFRSGVIAKRSGAPARIGLSDAREMSTAFYTEKRTVPEGIVHAVDRYRALVAPQATDPVEFPLAIDDAARAEAQALLGSLGLSPGERFVAVNPGARWASKQWLSERFGAVAAWLHAHIGLRSVCIGARSFRKQAHAVERAGGDAVLNATGRTSLKGLAALLDQALFLLTNDSGPMHLAVAVGTPVVALFGPTDPAKIGPYGPNHEVVRVPLDCVPCAKRDCTEKRSCMDLLDVDRVVHACQHLLERLDASSDVEPTP
ncbi:MAG: lipopolysaccharide heptosyltransferase II [Verrucomicrobia bacterium]|nr:lipopolysaccharide heptosyltransferase II [Verrucomicrobiota bacterium]